MHTGSFLNISIDAGSSGASPPFGEAITISAFPLRTLYAWANSGCMIWYGQRELHGVRMGE